ncbi:alpha/beta fold hydrolase [Denitromonas iodatirespirans]|uniref:Alpha/beta fold hydrolase n=1 Tax=Denitromonas iodatirespirans TaxID=2795389 RepID=A0A944D594_DENI1|nr:alpha/beta fold hydrolase [Denitromonas iodatirespirans]MBT0960179.1 alpha/beta fold hydrolase [Denitromonas iodatirespirans]
MSRPPLVLLHGWGLAPSVWQPLRAQLDADWPCHTPALPGHDATAPAPAAPTLAAWTDALAPALPDGALVCGWSLGTLVAMDLALRHPAKVARLALIGASPCFVQQPDWPCALATDTVDSFRRDFAAEPDKTLRRFIALQALGDAGRREVTRHLGASLAPLDTAAGLADGLTILAHTDLRAAATAIDCPVRLLHGAHDALMPADAARWLADALPQARYSEFTDAGHAPFITRAADCATLLQGFADD